MLVLLLCIISFLLLLYYYLFYYFFFFSSPPPHLLLLLLYYVFVVVSVISYFNEVSIFHSTCFLFFLMTCVGTCKRIVKVELKRRKDFVVYFFKVYISCLCCLSCLWKGRSTNTNHSSDNRPSGSFDSITTTRRNTRLGEVAQLRLVWILKLGGS